MGFTLGIVGLPNVGKSTLFNLLAQAKVDVSNYPFTTIKPNVGVVAVPDERVAQIAAVVGSAKTVPTVIGFYDIAGLVKGAHRGEGLGNQFLAHIREVNAIAHVVRCFPDPNITHVEGTVDPRRDIELINAELILADLATLESKLAPVKSALKIGDKNVLKYLHLLEKIKGELDSGRPARKVLPALSHEDLALLADLPLLTFKPVLYVANVDETGNRTEVDGVKALAAEENAGVVAICAKLEGEINELPPAEAEEYLKSVGLEDFALPRLIRAGYRLLDLITFFTANAKECRAWTVKQGTRAPRAVGQVHSAMEKGFIAAEVIGAAELVRAGSYAAARERGWLRTEGKEYQVKDGDLILVRFTP
ncbi:MAG: redox-regulated ATPase YchF [Candidatus Margulisiibacteriota bacterium]